MSIEIRQNLIDSEGGAGEWAGVIGDALEPILADSDLYEIMNPE